MRRLLTELRDYLGELVFTGWRGWQAFFFAPADPTALGLIRVIVGLLAFWSLLIFGLDLGDYFGSQGWADPTVIGPLQRQLHPLYWSFWYLVADGWLRAVWMLCLAVLGLYTAGLFSRTTGVLAWVIIVSTVRRLPIALFGFDQILSTLALYLAVSFASGQAVSLDRFFKRWRSARAAARQVKPPGSTGGRRVSPEQPGAPRPTVSANLALRLIQLHLVFIYANAGLAKLQGPSWWTGLALWGTLTAGEFVTRDFTWISRWPTLVNFLTHASLAFELLYPVLIWIRITRPLLLAGAVVLHIGIALVAPGLTEFGVAMMAANLAFVSGTWLRSLVTGRQQPAVRVLFDGACPRCRASMALLTAADPDRVIEPIDLTAVQVESLHPALTHDACMKSMHVLLRDGRVKAGFDAVRAIGGWLPLFWLPTLFAWLPGVAWVGRFVYNMVAVSRRRDAVCTDEACGIHFPERPAKTGAHDVHSEQPVSDDRVFSEELHRP
ncbi:MAG: DCC1-like thiol-disulfide oxidoreductase family protein [Isosphaeraceae bacterium]